MTPRVGVTTIVDVTVDEATFTASWMAEFRRHFYDFYTIEDHLGHLAQLYAHEIVDESTEFIEGYGPVDDMGIEFEHIGFEIEVVP